MIRLATAMFALFTAALLPEAALAVPVFKYDTVYNISGSFNFDQFGTMTLTAGSTLFYDSTADVLTINAHARSDRYTTGLFDIDYSLGNALPKNGAAEADGVVRFKRDNSKVTFDYEEGAMVKNGMTQMGTFTPEFTFSLPGNRRIDADREYTIFSKGMNPNLFIDKGRLVFQSWVGIWGRNPKFDIKSDPRFYLREKGPTEIPEPFTLGLLGAGLAGGAIMRKRRPGMNAEKR